MCGVASELVFVVTGRNLSSFALSTELRFVPVIGFTVLSPLVLLFCDAEYKAFIVSNFDGSFAVDGFLL